ncbi:hypothetical protein QAD02_014934 [Eretmocerus hayati]|uniref:Uncharacterized protein n=1 Tax=Eretmocerus hayati TaxID=131215 RepID=A0ACC2P777_9HYME|nr:hypothetical protein QAD02_014934 [Eretmocerus hayati]
MISLQDLPVLLFFITKLTRFHPKAFYYLLLIHYMYNRLQALFKMQLKLHAVSEAYFSSLITTHGKFSKNQVDENLYILCNPSDVETSGQWAYLCCRAVKKRYKVVVIQSHEVLQNCIYISESLKFNVDTSFGVEELVGSAYFFFPAHSNETEYAEEVRISLVSNPCEYSDENMKSLLQKFFTFPRYLRVNNIFRINVGKISPEFVYCGAKSEEQYLHFKVNNIKGESEGKTLKEAFILYGRTTLIQQSNLNHFLPPRYFPSDISDQDKWCSYNWPPILRQQLQELQQCIAPFMIKNLTIGLRPVFCLVGPAGTGKSQLAKAVAKVFGLHYIIADFGDVQSLTSAQTEAKFRIILNDAEKSVPCILILKNIQIFGINSEGHTDERVISAFVTELDKLYKKKLDFPLIIIATSTESEISVDTKSVFIERITMKKLNHEEKCGVLSWFIKTKGLEHVVDLPKVAKMCSDFVLADLKVLVLHAVKERLKKFGLHKESGQMVLVDEDIMDAYEHMKTSLSREIGVPSVPKVHWDDIGGLADLKHEIMRRIQMPLLNIQGMGRSGLLLYGPPGTGKTLLAKAVATECQLHFLSVKGPELLNMYVGQSEKNVRQVFERARSAAPCIIFFDELDSLAPNRGQSGDSGGVMDRVVSQLLAEMDGLGSSGDVSIIAATNRPDLIDPALLRPGRFDKMLYVGIYSDAESQLGVLKALTKQFIFEKGAQELEELVTKLPSNLTGADLYSICSNAWLKAVRRILTKNETDREELCESDIIVKLEDFLRANEELIPSVSEKELTRYEKLQRELSSR